VEVSADDVMDMLDSEEMKNFTFPTDEPCENLKPQKQK